MNFRPLHDRVVLKRVEEDTKTKGGIIIPETAQEKPMQGEIIAVGPGARDESGKVIALDVKKGVNAGVKLGHAAAQKSTTWPMGKGAGKRDSGQSAAPTGGWRVTGRCGPRGPIREDAGYSACGDFLARLWARR
jgi:co-chaperonin GroES (HSP10)